MQLVPFHPKITGISELTQVSPTAQGSRADAADSEMKDGLGMKAQVSTLTLRAT